MKHPEIFVSRHQEFQISKNLDDFTYQQIEILKKEAVWKNLASISLKLAVNEWLSTLSPLTAKNYASGINVLTAYKIIDPEQSLQKFALENHDAVLDRIKGLAHMSDCTKQARSALYIALTRFLSRRTEGLIRRAIPSREGTSKTFWRVRDKVVSEALNRSEWERLIKAMETLNRRDALVVKLCLQGARRIREVLNLQTRQVSIEKRQVTFVQSKTRGIFKETIVTVPEHIAGELKDYIGDRQSGHVFITSSNKPVGYTQILESLQRGGKLALIHKKLHPHVLRTSAITYLRGLGFQDFEIQRLTGHASSQMLNAYDKVDREENVSKRVALI